MTLTDFLLARISEDEVVARRAGDEEAPRFDWKLDGSWWLEGVNHAVVGPDEVAFTDDDCATQIARHDPARVLRECEAKREIVRRCGDVGALMPSEHLAQGVLGLLASVYSDHPDFRVEWR